MTGMDSFVFWWIDWEKDNKKRISSKVNRMSLICHAPSSQMKYTVWSTVFLKLAKINEMDRAHNRENDNPETGPLSRPPDFHIGT